ncbi:MAG TPA: hypothetical protein VG937_10480 [Polyangiaceae bacterium]|nr:hypothetical protein [Polyangiaceae bacterium]
MTTDNVETSGKTAEGVVEAGAKTAEGELALLKKEREKAQTDLDSVSGRVKTLTEKIESLEKRVVERKRLVEGVSARKKAFTDEQLVERATQKKKMAQAAINDDQAQAIDKLVAGYDEDVAKKAKSVRELEAKSEASSAAAKAADVKVTLAQRQKEEAFKAPLAFEKLIARCHDYQTRLERVKDGEFSAMYLLALLVKMEATSLAGEFPTPEKIEQDVSKLEADYLSAVGEAAATKQQEALVRTALERARAEHSASVEKRVDNLLAAIAKKP